MAQTTPLKRVRQQAGLLQKDVAKQLGISVQHYNEVENGRRPSLKLALLLAKLFGVSIEELIGD